MLSDIDELLLYRTRSERCGKASVYSR